MVFLFHNVKQIFTDHLVTDIHARQSQQSFGNAFRTDQVGDLLAARERTAANDQRNVQAAVVAGALVIIIAIQVRITVAGLEMRTMIGGVEDDRIVI